MKFFVFRIEEKEVIELVYVHIILNIYFVIYVFGKNIFWDIT